MVGCQGAFSDTTADRVREQWFVTIALSPHGQSIIAARTTAPSHSSCFTHTISLWWLISWTVSILTDLLSYFSSAVFLNVLLSRDDEQMVFSPSSPPPPYSQSTHKECGLQDKRCPQLKRKTMKIFSLTLCYWINHKVDNLYPHPLSRYEPDVHYYL